MTLKRLIIVLALAGAATAEGASVAAVRGTDGAGRKLTEVIADRPALVLLTSPRVADVGGQLRLLRYIANELGEEAAIAAVIYGEEPAKLAKLRAGMPYPLVAGAGGIPPEVLGQDGKVPMLLVLGPDGEIRGRRGDVPDPLAAADLLGIRYDAGPPGPPVVGELLPDLILAGSDGRAHNLRAESALKAKTLLFLFDVEGAGRDATLANLQHLADDLGDDLAVVPVMMGASARVAAKLAEAAYMDIPVLVGGPLAARRLLGKLELPTSIMAEEHGVVFGARERARVPSRIELVAEEAGPATEGEPVALTVARVAPLSTGLKSNAVPVAVFDASGRYVIYAGHYAAGDVDHLYEVTAAGKDRRQISYAPAPDIAPASSPDGVHLAFASGRSGASEIWISERVRGEFTQITKSGGLFGAPAYSPDGRWLVAPRRVVAGDAQNFDLWLFSERGRRPRAVAETFYDEIEPAFGSEGNLIFFASSRYGNWDIFSSDLRGGKRRRLTGPETDDRMPAPSPDGKYIVYASRSGGGPYKLWAMNADGSSKVQLTFGPGDDLYPRFAPNGLALVFVSARTGSFQVYKMKFEPPPDYDLPRPPRPLAGRAVS